MTNIPNIPLNDGNVIPQFGLGVWRTAPAETQAIVEHALSVGYRHIDTAALYENEREVGRAVRASGVPRERVFVTTKLWNDRQLDARAALEESLEKLGFDYVNLYLVHWPVPQQNTYADAWRTLIELRADGLTRSIGVSNFEAEHLDRVMAEGVTPAVNQIELHPTFAQFDLVDANTSRGIATQSWRPLGHGEDLDNPTVAGIAAATGKTPAQVVLRWHLQRGLIVFPKSRQPHRVTENLDVFDFELTPDQMAAINALDAGNRMGGDPRVFAG
jgi:2,5-diketo-D-gluconate reductase A